MPKGMGAVRSDKRTLPSLAGLGGPSRSSHAVLCSVATQGSTIQVQFAVACCRSGTRCRGPDAAADLVDTSGGAVSASREARRGAARLRLRRGEARRSSWSDRSFRVGAGEKEREIERRWARLGKRTACPCPVTLTEGAAARPRSGRGQQCKRCPLFAALDRRWRTTLLVCECGASQRAAGGAPCLKVTHAHHADF